VTSTRSAPDLPEDLFPGNAYWSVAFEVIQPTIKFFPLVCGQRNCLRRLAEAIPEVFQQPKALLSG